MAFSLVLVTASSQIDIHSVKNGCDGKTHLIDPFDRKAEMLAIIISACAISHADACKTYRITLGEDVNLMQCTLFAQAEVAKWSAEHPELKVKQWKCTLAGANDI